MIGLNKTDPNDGLIGPEPLRINLGNWKNPRAFSSSQNCIVAFKGEFPLAYSLLTAYVNPDLTVVLSEVKIGSAGSHFILGLSSKRHRMSGGRYRSLARQYGRSTSTRPGR